MRRAIRMESTAGGRVWLRQLSTLALTLLLALATAAGVVAQDGQQGVDSLDLTDAPVALHDGSCASPIIEPAFEIGDLQRQDLGEVTIVPIGGEDLNGNGILDEGEDLDGDGELDTGYDVDVDDDGVLNVDEDGYLDEDANNNGVLDEGEDANANGTLDVGIDEDGNDILDENEIIPRASTAPLPTVWKVEDEVDATFEEIFGANENEDDTLDDPGIVAVHASSADFGTLVACGEVTYANWEDQDTVVIGLHPIEGSGIYGYAVFERDTGNIPIFGDNTTGVTVYAFENLPSLRESRMAEATPTP